MSEGIEKEIGVLRKALFNDPDYYNTWQANIAVQFQDAYEHAVEKRRQSLDEDPVSIHEVSNQAAKNFLNLLIGGSYGRSTKF